MLFKLDENLPASLVAVFSSADHDAISAVEQDLQGAQDTMLADVCRDEGRTLVTVDKGFADIRSYPPAQYPGIIVLRLGRYDVPYVRATICRVIRLLAEYPVEKTLWIVEDERVRFRR